MSKKFMVIMTLLSEIHIHINDMHAYIWKTYDTSKKTSEYKIWLSNAYSCLGTESLNSYNLFWYNLFSNGWCIIEIGYM